MAILITMIHATFVVLILLALFLLFWALRRANRAELERDRETRRADEADLRAAQIQRTMVAVIRSSQDGEPARRLHVVGKGFVWIAGLVTGVWAAVQKPANAVAFGSVAIVAVGVVIGPTVYRQPHVDQQPPAPPQHIIAGLPPSVTVAPAATWQAPRTTLTAPASSTTPTPTAVPTTTGPTTTTTTSLLPSTVRGRPIVASTTVTVTTTPATSDPVSTTAAPVSGPTTPSTPAPHGFCVRLLFLLTLGDCAPQGG